MIRYKKFESATDDILIATEVWFWDHCASESNFDDEVDFANSLEGLINGTNEEAVDECCDDLVAMGYDDDVVFDEDLRNDIADRLSELAIEFKDDNDVDVDNIEFNSYNLESRVRRLEKKLYLKCKNEAVKKLPNGESANSVADVLSGFTGVSWNDSKGAIRKLNRMGILDAATNKWYTTVDDIADAIEDCWNDQIGSVGKGAAQFFIGNIGGDVRCSLTIYPISGGDSRARNITLKFNWPKSEM
jgi:hypothetical protein